MIKLLKNYQVKTYDMIIDRMVIVNLNQTGISRNIPVKMDQELKYINDLTKRLKREV